MTKVGFLPKIRDFAASRVAAYGEQYSATAIFFIVFYIANPLKWQFSGHYNVTTLVVLRVISVVLSLALSLWKFWPKKIASYLPLFWLFVLFYNLPFRTTFSIFHSAYSGSYAAFGVLGFVVLAVMVDNFLYVCLTTAGAITGILVYYLFGGHALPLIPLSTIAQAAYMVCTISFIKLVFFRNHNIRLESKISSYKILAGAIAHEVRGPLSTINVTCQGIENNPGKSADLALKTIFSLSSKMSSIIDAILLQIKFIDSSSNIELREIALFDCINDAVQDPIFSDPDRAKISLKILEDQKIIGDKRLLSQVFKNLIRNALQAIKQAKHGQIKIEATSLENYLLVKIQDNGIGIGLNQQKNLFKPFYSLSKNGVGLGLAFSKLALESMGWSISCESQRGSFTRFDLTYKPQTNQKDVNI